MELLSIGQHGDEDIAYVVPFKPYNLDSVAAIITGLV